MGIELVLGELNGLEKQNEGKFSNGLRKKKSDLTKADFTNYLKL